MMNMYIGDLVTQLNQQLFLFERNITHQGVRFAILTLFNIDFID